MKSINLSQIKIIFLILLCAPLTSLAQDTLAKDNTFIISGQLRPRAELRYGNFQPLSKNDQPAALISQRTRLRFFYEYKDLLAVQISPQYINVWGQENLTQGVAANNGFGLYEAWARVRVSKNSNFIIGRQIISLDDERFFGELDWAQGGRVHDAISYNLKRQKFEFRAFLAYNQNYKAIYANNLSNISGNLYSPVGAAPHKWMQTVWAKFAINKKNSISLLATNLGFQTMLTANDTAKNYNSQTFGINYFHTGEKWKANASAYYQTGQNALGKYIVSYMAAIGASRKLGSKWNIGLASEIVSGNKVGGTPSSVSNVFTPYFATGHKFYGSMDYYYAGNGHKNAGLWDNYLTIGFSPSAKWSLGLAAHQFITPFGMNNGIKTLSPDLGQEFDLGFTVNINKFVKVMGGYSLYLSTPSLEFLKSSVNSRVDQHWAWVAINITPTFLNLKH